MTEEKKPRSGKVPAKPRTRESFKRFFRYLEEVELSDAFREILRRHHVSFWDVYGDVRGVAMFAARIECFWQLERLGRSVNQIARLFDRNADSVHYALRLLRNESGMMGIVLDEDNVYRVAVSVAEKGRANQRDNGKKRAADQNAFWTKSPRNGSVPGPTEET